MNQVERFTKKQEFYNMLINTEDSATATNLAGDLLIKHPILRNKQKKPKTKKKPPNTQNLPSTSQRFFLFSASDTEVSADDSSDCADTDFSDSEDEGNPYAFPVYNAKKPTIMVQ